MESVANLRTGIVSGETTARKTIEKALDSAEKL